MTDEEFDRRMEVSRQEHEAWFRRHEQALDDQAKRLDDQAKRHEEDHAKTMGEIRALAAASRHFLKRQEQVMEEFFVRMERLLDIRNRNGHEPPPKRKRS